MPEGFEQYLPLSDAKKREIWEEGTIILDTNVLLNAYRLRAEHRKQLLGILRSEGVRDRLFIPNRVAEEFYRNRLTVITEQEKTAAAFHKTVDKAIGELASRVDAAVRQHHPFVDREGFKGTIADMWSNQRAAIQSNRAGHSVSVQSDPIAEALDPILEGRIGPSFSEERVRQIREESSHRFAAKVPPGYKDADKNPEEAVGDLLVWRQILAKQGEHRAHAVFVTDDRKEDWWLIAQGKLLGPRPELRKEYQEATGKNVDFCTSERFIEWASARKGSPRTDASELALMFSALHEIAHEPEPFTSPSEFDQTPEGMAEWFLENYEDPVNGVPYESAEGGYQYYAGGPCDVREELGDTFPDASEGDIEKAIAILEWHGGTDWVRRGQYP